MENISSKGFFPKEGSTPTEGSTPVATRGVPLKVTIPDELMDNLNLFSECYGTSKSETVRIALKNMLSADPRWKWRAYFFKSKNPQVTYDRLLACSGIVSIVAGPNEYAKSSIKYYAKLLKFDRKEAVVEFAGITTFDIPSPQIVNSSEVNLNSGTLVIPDLLPTDGIIHKVANSFLWDVL